MTTVRAHLYVDSEEAEDALASVVSFLLAEGWDVDTDEARTWVRPLPPSALGYIGFGAQEQPVQVSLTAPGRTENDAGAASAVFDAIRQLGYVSYGGDAMQSADEAVVAGGKVTKYVGDHPGEVGAGALHAADDFTIAVVVAGVTILGLAAVYFFRKAS